MLWVLWDIAGTLGYVGGDLMVCWGTLEAVVNRLEDSNMEIRKKNKNVEVTLGTFLNCSLMNGWWKMLPSTMWQNYYIGYIVRFFNMSLVNIG